MTLEIKYTKERHPGRWVIVAFIIIILGLVGWFGYSWYTTGNLLVTLPIASANNSVDESNVSSDEVKSYTVPALNPRFITIPTLNMGNTRIYPVGIDTNNLTKSPANINDAAWYDKSATPGSGGVILIDGHNKGVTKNGAFAKLGILVKGDKITLQRGDGQMFTYSVVDNQSLSIDEANATGMAMMVKSAAIGKEALNLITFDGKWVPLLGAFDRLILLRAVIVDTK